MGEFFNPEKGIWAWLSTLVDLCGLSIVWVFLCLPVVTAGPATAALYYAVVKCIRGRESGAFAAYLRSFRANLKTGLLATLAVLPAAGPAPHRAVVRNAGGGRALPPLCGAVFCPDDPSGGAELAVPPAGPV